MSQIERDRTKKPREKKPYNFLLKLISVTYSRFPLFPPALYWLEEMIKVGRLLVQLRKVKRRTYISAFRAGIAITILFVLLFLDAFERIQNENLAMTSMILSVIVTGPGRSTGTFDEALSFLNCQLSWKLVLLMELFLLQH